ncbi:TPA: type 1 fimbrial protein [Escherichia coli]|nr:type 1 fimbrial protein [Escherichia coli]HDY2306531.1 type 1 fimbrial protein [Escherichia coli]
MNKVIMATMLASTISFGVNAADQGHGVVNFKGIVIDAPCGIAPESADQTIDFGQISKSHLESGGISIKKDLNIKLVNCDISGADAKKKVQVTFSGATVNSHNDELGTAGDTGTAVVISGQDGRLVSFGTAGTAQNLKDGDNTLHYSSWVKKASGSSVKEGAFTAVADFNLTYN